MKKKAIILDLDNTIFPVDSIGERLFRDFFKLVEDSGEFEGDMEQLKKDIMSKPFQGVADEYKFSDNLKQQSDRLLEDLSYEGEIVAFEDFDVIRALPCLKFIVTAGYRKMQQSKIDRLELKRDFRETIIIDPKYTDKTKKDVFADILKRYNLSPEEVLVIGDDPDSEIRYAEDLGIEAVLYDQAGLNKNIGQSEKIMSFYQLNIQCF